MPKLNAKNERIKRRYFIYLKEANRMSEAAIDGAARALDHFETYTGFKDFKTFYQQQAIDFKHHLEKQTGLRSGKKLSKATLNSELKALKRFFHWLAGQPGFKSRFAYSDAEYFNLSHKDARVATARRSKPCPTLDQVRHVLAQMPYGTDIEKRDRALVAFVALTGARDGAVASLKLKHVDPSLTRPAWIEADLDKIFTEGLFADFSALWLVIHASRFGAPDASPSDCPLERWRERGRIDGSPATARSRPRPTRPNVTS